MVLYPTSLVLSVDLLGDSLNQVTREWIESINRQGFSKVKAWVCPISVDEPYNNGGLEDALQYLMLSKNGRKPKKSFDFELDDGSSATVFSQRFCDDKKIRPCELSVNITESKVVQIPQYLQASAELCRYYLHQGRMLSAKLYRRGGGLSCLPYPPIAEGDTHLVVTTVAEVEQYYQNPQIFWQAWDTIEQYGDKYLLLRGMDCTDDVSFLSEIIHQQWQLAGATKQTVTRYYFGPKSEEVSVFNMGESRLNIVGYIAKECLVEYACWLEPGENIPGWEIYQIWQLFYNRSLDDGSPVNAVRVMFPNQQMAQTQQRVLVDMRIYVAYYDSNGVDWEISDEYQQNLQTLELTLLPQIDPDYTQKAVPRELSNWEKRLDGLRSHYYEPLNFPQLEAVLKHKEEQQGWIRDNVVAIRAWVLVLQRLYQRTQDANLFEELLSELPPAYSYLQYEQWKQRLAARFRDLPSQPLPSQ